MKPEISPLRAGDPKEFDGWALKGVIGEGGFSTIFLAEKDSQQVALKMIRKENLYDPMAVDRFFTEIKNLELLNHPNIAKYLSSNDSTSVPYFAVEYIEGVTLDKKVELEGPITGDEWLRLALHLAETLNYCHSQGIIHKDVSPGNIVIGDVGPVFIDFGLSYLEKDPHLTTVEQSVGTPPFMSPEQFGSERSFAMDAFSLASTLIYAGTGRYPFHGKSKIEWQESICHDKPNFEGLSKQQELVLTPLLYKSYSERISLDVFIAQVKDFLGLVDLNEANRKIVSEALLDADLKLAKTRKSEEKRKLKARNSIKKLALSATLAGLSIVVITNLLSGAGTQASKSSVTSTASLEASPSPFQLEAAFGSGQTTSSPNSNGSKPSSCSEFSIRDNVEAEVLRTCQALINSGDLTAYYNIGFYYYEQGRTKEAIDWWQKGADKKSALSMYKLAGVLYENGETSQAKKWYQACVDSATTGGGKAWCMNGLGKIFYQEKDIKESRRWYQLSANLGDQEGYYRVGMNYASTKEWQKALDNYLEIKNPNLGTKILIADAYDGLGNEDQALVWYKKAADDGSADALVNVGVIYYVKEDYKNAIQAWKKASALGSGTASYKLARLYSEQKNTEEAAKYDKIGATQGDIGSIFFYGFYLQGKEDYKNAKVWYQKGVDRNDPTSMVQLGAILSAIEDDIEGACKLWEKASDLGNAKAKENVTRLCAANPSKTPYLISSSEDLTMSLPLSKTVLVDEIFGRVFKSGLDWLVPLSVTTDRVPPITSVQFRLVGFPDAPWFGLPYKLKNLEGGVYAQVDDLFLSVLFKRQVCPEFRFVQESKGEIVKVWNKQQPECATDFSQ